MLLKNFELTAFGNVESIYLWENNNRYRDIQGSYLMEKVGACRVALSKGSILLGSGNTPATVNDYCIEQGFPSSVLTYSGQSVNSILETDTQKIKWLYTATVRNISDETIEIKEAIATLMYLWYESGQISYSGIGNFAIAREVLSTPLIIVPRDSRTVVIEICY